MKKTFSYLMILLALLGLNGCGSDTETEFLPYYITNTTTEEVQVEVPGKLQLVKYPCPIIPNDPNMINSQNRDINITLPIVSFLDDGRMIVADGDWYESDGPEVAIETSPGSKQFDLICLPTDTTGAPVYMTNFMTISSESIFIGTYGKTGELPIIEIKLSDYSADIIFDMPNYSGAYFDGSLYINGSAGAGATITKIDIDNIDNKKEVIKIAGASGGILINNGTLYTAPGTNPQSGRIKKFEIAELAQKNEPVIFEDSNDIFFQSTSASSMATFGDYMFVANSLMVDWACIDNHCSIVSLDNGTEIMTLDLDNTGINDSYNVSGNGNKLAIIHTRYATLTETDLYVGSVNN